MSAEITAAAPKKKKMWISTIKKNAHADLKAAEEATRASIVRDDYPGVMFTLPDNSLRLIAFQDGWGVVSWQLQQRVSRPQSSENHRWTNYFSVRSKAALVDALRAQGIDDPALNAFVETLPLRSFDADR